MTEWDPEQTYRRNTIRKLHLKLHTNRRKKGYAKRVDKKNSYSKNEKKPDRRLLVGIYIGLNEDKITKQTIFFVKNVPILTGNDFLVIKCIKNNILLNVVLKNLVALFRL